MTELIAEFQTTPIRCTRVLRVELSGAERIIVQEYDIHRGRNREPTWMPTTHSVTIRPESVPDLIAALQQAVQPADPRPRAA
jgi:hypothetical protein